MPMAFEILPGPDLNQAYISPPARVARLSLNHHYLKKMHRDAHWRAKSDSLKRGACKLNYQALRQYL
jgi:hypothetical protein